jgi:hypothetical protein
MPIPQPLDPPARLLCGPGLSDVEPSVPAAMRRPMLGHLDSTLKAAPAMPDPSSGSPTPASRTPRGPAWDAALRPAQLRAGLDRARLEQRRLADARRQRLIAVWLRELANH